METNSDNKKIFLTNIQRFSLHDGPGIRTTVFLKGCSLRCPWCSNPENIEKKVQKYVKDGIEGNYGKFISSNDLFIEIMKDYSFYSGKLKSNEWGIKNDKLLECLPGGVTFSGGEALLQIRNLADVINKIHVKKVHVAIETCLFVSKENLELGIDFIDLFYVDVKILNYCKARLVHGGDIDIFKENFRILMNSKKPVIIRIPVIGGYTDDEENRKAIINFIKVEKEYGNILKIELIKGHNLGNSKYKSLGMKIPDYVDVDNKFMEEYKEDIEKNIGIVADVCKI